jgi:multidrug efflux pump subunit AcrA (membrane-fusion protein)
MICFSIRSSRFLALGMLSIGCGRTPPQAAEETAPPAPVKVVRAKRLPAAEWTAVLGVTQPLPNRVARVSAPVEGQVRDHLQVRDGAGRPIVEGMVVAKGQVIAQLDDRVLRANRAKLVATQAELTEQQWQAELAVEAARIDVKRSSSSASAAILCKGATDRLSSSLRRFTSAMQASRLFSCH